MSGENEENGASGAVRPEPRAAAAERAGHLQDGGGATDHADHRQRQPAGQEQRAEHSQHPQHTRPAGGEAHDKHEGHEGHGGHGGHEDHREMLRKHHEGMLWCTLTNVVLGLWLIGSAASVAYGSEPLRRSDLISGALIVAFGVVALVRRWDLARWREIRVRVRRHNGGDPFMGRHHRRLLLEAGFARAEAGASVSGAGSPEETRRHAAFLRAQLEGFARTAVAEGWTDQPSVDAVAAEIDAWAARPDAFAAGFYCHAVAWVTG